MAPHAKRRPLEHEADAASNHRAGKPNDKTEGTAVLRRLEFRVTWRRVTWCDRTADKTRLFARRADAEKFVGAWRPVL